MRTHITSSIIKVQTKNHKPTLVMVIFACTLKQTLKPVNVMFVSIAQASCTGAGESVQTCSLTRASATHSHLCRPRSHIQTQIGYSI